MKKGKIWLLAVLSFAMLAISACGSKNNSDLQTGTTETDSPQEDIAEDIKEEDLPDDVIATPEPEESDDSKSTEVPESDMTEESNPEAE